MTSDDKYQAALRRPPSKQHAHAVSVRGDTYRLIRELAAKRGVSASAFVKWLVDREGAL